MAYPQVRSSNSGSNSSGTSPQYVLPSPISEGDGIVIITAVDGSATITANPSGFTSKLASDATAYQQYVFSKVADGTEGGTTVIGTLSAIESSVYAVLVFSGWSGNLADIVIGTPVIGSGATVDPGSVTATWGADDNLFICAAMGDLWDRIATAFPTNYSSNQITQEHQDQFGGTQAISLAAREYNSASDDPDSYTLTYTSGAVISAITMVVKPAAGSPALTSPTDPVELGSTGNTVTKTNFSGDITLEDQSSGYTYTITDQTSSTVTFNGPPLTTITEASGGVVVPEPGEAITLVGTHTPTDPDEVATVATNISLPSGYAQVTLSGSSNVAGTVGYGIDAIHGITVADGWIIVYPTSDSTSVSADGTLYTNSDDLYIYGWNPTDDKMYGVRGLWVTPGGTAQKTFNIGIGISI